MAKARLFRRRPTWCDRLLRFWLCVVLLGTLAIIARGGQIAIAYGGPPIRDRDCRDFRTQAEAQAFFQTQGPGDPHNFDADHLGKICEWNVDHRVSY